MLVHEIQSVQNYLPLDSFLLHSRLNMPLKLHQFKHLVSILPDIHVFKIQLRSFASILEVCLTSLEPGFQCTQPPNQVVNAHLSSSHPLLMHRHLPVPTGNRILVCHTVPRLLFLLHPLKTNYPPLNFQATPMQRTQTTSYNRLYQTKSYSKPATELVIDHMLLRDPKAKEPDERLQQATSEPTCETWNTKVTCQTNQIDQRIVLHIQLGEPPHSFLAFHQQKSTTPAYLFQATWSLKQNMHRGASSSVSIPVI